MALQTRHPWPFRRATQATAEPLHAQKTHVVILSAAKDLLLTMRIYNHPQRKSQQAEPLGLSSGHGFSPAKSKCPNVDFLLRHSAQAFSAHHLDRSVAAQSGHPGMSLSAKCASVPWNSGVNRFRSWNLTPPVRYEFDTIPECHSPGMRSATKPSPSRKNGPVKKASGPKSKRSGTNSSTYLESVAAPSPHLRSR
jgi:hypothetical protein